MKPNSNTLYQLIHSLSSSEKRYFKLFAQRHQIKEINNYLVLYENIVQHKIKDDKDTQQFFQNKRFKNYLPVAKIQLFHNILKSLDAYHQTGTVKEQIKTKLHQAQILIDKGILKEAESLITKSIKLAKRYEFLALINESFLLLEKIIALKNYREISFEKLEDFHKEKKHYLELLNNYYQYWNLFSLIYKYHFQKIKSKEKNANNELKKWFRDELLLDENLAKTVQAKIMFFQLNALKNFLNNEPEKAFDYNKKILEILEENPFVKEINAKKFLSILNNYLIDCLQLDKTKELDKGLQKLRALPKEKAYKKLPDTKIHVFRFSNLIELNRNISKGDFLQNTILIPNINKELASLKNKIAFHTQTTFQYLFLYSYFAIGNYDKSIDWANKIIDQSKSKTVEELQISARLILLLAHFEIGNESLLEYTISNTRRYHKREEKLFKLEATILSYISKLIKTPKTERHSIILDLKKALEEIKAENKEKNIFNNFDYLAWVNSKIQNISFVEAFRK